MRIARSNTNLSPFLIPVARFSGGGTVDFQEFVGGLSAFSSRGGRDEKLRCPSPPHSLCPGSYLYDTVAFKVYDVDRDGFISNGELFLVLKMMVGNNLKVQCAHLHYTHHLIDTLVSRINNSNR